MKDPRGGDGLRMKMMAMTTEVNHLLFASWTDQIHCQRDPGCEEHHVGAHAEEKRR